MNNETSFINNGVYMLVYIKDGYIYKVGYTDEEIKKLSAFVKEMFKDRTELKVEKTKMEVNINE